MPKTAPKSEIVPRERRIVGTTAGQSPSDTEMVDLYKAGMRRLAAGVSLITSGSGEQRAGLIATAVISVSMHPPTLLICVNQSASAHPVITETRNFCVNVLATESIDIAGQFSSSTRRHERFTGGNWVQSARGAPLLKDALVAFDCEVVFSLAYGTHTIFFGKIMDVQLNGDGPHEPLLYLDRAFRAASAALPV